MKEISQVCDGRMSPRLGEGANPDRQPGTLAQTQECELGKDGHQQQIFIKESSEMNGSKMQRMGRA